MRSRNDRIRQPRRVREDIKEDEEGHSVEEIGVSVAAVNKAIRVMGMLERQHGGAPVDTKSPPPPPPPPPPSDPVPAPRVEEAVAKPPPVPPPPPPVAAAAAAPPAIVEDERKPTPVVLTKAQRQAREDAILKGLIDEDDDVQVAPPPQVPPPRLDAPDNYNPFLMMMGPQPEIETPPPPPPPPPVDDDPLHLFSSPKRDAVDPLAASTTEATTPTTAAAASTAASRASARRESFDEKAAFSLPPEPGTVSRRRGPPPAQKPGAEFVRLRAPGMRPSWFEGRRGQSEEAEGATAGRGGAAAATTPTSTEQQPSELEQVPDDEPDLEAADEQHEESEMAVDGAAPNGATADGNGNGEEERLREGVTTDIRTMGEQEENANVDWTTASCTPMPSTGVTSFAEEMSPAGDGMRGKGHQSRCCLLVATYGCGIMLGVGIGIGVWAIYDQLK